MIEKCPDHLDEDGKSLWEQCEWILSGGSVQTSTILQLQALAIRRELRQESRMAELETENAALQAWALHTCNDPECNRGMCESGNDLLHAAIDAARR